ncbi:putative efflux pump antibiotic resistance protein [Zalerion maritima]|uniref:Efflux pump antibiotic resistance protein n=1 Tax=Zalerion maritima TaxID=339359 RepID=A0AAD5WQ82_9PEZI|nr:putative efflux pump antibiotic resistance protein [Zalerion maritima]
MLEPNKPSSPSASASAPPPLSEAPTIAPSRASVSDLGKTEDGSLSGDAPPPPATVRSDNETNIQEKTETGTHGLERSPTPSISAAGEEDMQRHRTREDGMEYPSGVKLQLITLALCLAVFLMALDNSIIATAIPEITNDFKSLSDVGWYGSAYLLTTASLQLLFGRFYTFFSIKWIFLIAISLFELGSLVCGVAPNSVALILGRAIAGVGSAGIFSGALIILAHSVPLASRPMYTGFIGSMYGIASVSGPLLGGVFTDKVTWRWCFYINLPIGAVTVAVIAFFFPDPHRVIPKNEPWAKRIRQFDPLGTTVFMPGVICLLLALQWGGTEYEWDDARIIALLVLFGVLIIGFVVVQWWMQENATVAPRIFLKRSVWSSFFFAFFIGACFLCSIYFLPIWFQAVKGASAVKSGVMNIPMLISLVLCSIASGIMVTVLGYYTPFMIFGTVLAAIGYGLITMFTPDTDSGKWIGYQILAGAGVGFALQQPLMAVQTVLDIKDVPTGTALIAFGQTLGGALFVSIGQNVFTNGLVDNIAKMVPEIDPAIVLATGATSIKDVIPAEFLDAVIEAYNGALADTFKVSAATAAIAIIGALFVEWKSVKGKNIEMAAA